MRDEIVIREAQPEDVAEIVRHRRRMYEDMTHSSPPAIGSRHAILRLPPP